ncbi:MAG: hypothetical protein BGO21_20310 [Dyadobacter sp. 50-39]|nr:MAG: hypothetical protein BGO21_20310 [Dyadobacter sp. 50-39]
MFEPGVGPGPVYVFFTGLPFIPETFHDATDYFLAIEPINNPPITAPYTVELAGFEVMGHVPEEQPMKW